MIVFDTETTGLLKSSIVDLNKQPKIIEYAAIKLDDNSLDEIDRIEFLVNPEQKLEPIITKITGLTDKDLFNQKTFSAHYGQLAKFHLGEKFLFAHNMQFDISLLKFELMRIGRETQFPYPPAQICTVNKTIHINGYRLNLAKLYKFLFNKEMKEAHRAMIDVEYLTKCVKELIKREIIKLK
jgi:DNA polymerase-3 subunit alpha (Gram-positive type)